jgi:hypothetical protein
MNDQIKCRMEYMKKAVSQSNQGDDRALKLLATELQEGREAKQVLRDKGYGWIGLSLLKTIEQLVPDADE